MVSRLALALLLLSAPAGAGGPTRASSAQVGSTPAVTAEFTGRATIVDGDTIRVGDERIRLRSEAGPIDAPELHRAKCPLELFRAEAARDRLRELMAPASLYSTAFLAENRGIRTRDSAQHKASPV